jgi:hypothetical protein
MPPERSDKSDSLEARLRRLPPPPVPADLEARLLAAIPAQGSNEHRLRLSAKPQVMFEGRRWAWWAGGVSALAAACLLIVLLWPKGNGQKPDQKDNGFAGNVPIRSVRPQSPQDATNPWLQARGPSDEPKLPPFTWPVEETTHVTLSSSIPSDLLD